MKVDDGGEVLVAVNEHVEGGFNHRWIPLGPFAGAWVAQSSLAPETLYGPGLSVATLST